jgi:hypothetical protein
VVKEFVEEVMAEDMLGSFCNAAEWGAYFHPYLNQVARDRKAYGDSIW